MATETVLDNLRQSYDGLENADVSVSLVNGRALNGWMVFVKADGLILDNKQGNLIWVPYHAIAYVM